MYCILEDDFSDAHDHPPDIPSLVDEDDDDGLAGFQQNSIRATDLEDCFDTHDVSSVIVTVLVASDSPALPRRKPFDSERHQTRSSFVVWQRSMTARTSTMPIMAQSWHAPQTIATSSSRTAPSLARMSACLTPVTMRTIQSVSVSLLCIPVDKTFDPKRSSL